MGVYELYSSLVKRNAMSNLLCLVFLIIGSSKFVSHKEKKNSYPHDVRRPLVFRACSVHWLFNTLYKR